MQHLPSLNTPFAASSKRGFSRSLFRTSSSDTDCIVTSSLGLSVPTLRSFCHLRSAIDMIWYDMILYNIIWYMLTGQAEILSTNMLGSTPPTCINCQGGLNWKYLCARCLSCHPDFQLPVIPVLKSSQYRPKFSISPLTQSHQVFLGRPLCWVPPIFIQHRQRNVSVISVTALTYFRGLITKKLSYDFL